MLQVKVGAGRPTLFVDWDIVDSMLADGSPGTEISGCLGVCPHTLYSRCIEENGENWSNYSQKMQQTGCYSIRRKQMTEALGGNITMLIWLGKQRLGQRETFTDHTPPNDKKLDSDLTVIKSTVVHDAIEQQADPELPASD